MPHATAPHNRALSALLPVMQNTTNAPSQPAPAAPTDTDTPEKAGKAPDEKRSEAARPAESLRARTQRHRKHVVRRTETVEVTVKCVPDEDPNGEPYNETLTYEVRPMMAGAKTRLTSEGFEEKTVVVNGRSSTTPVPILDRYFGVVVRESTYDPASGERLWNSTEADLQEVLALPPAVFDPLVAAGIRVNGLSKAARQALGED